MRLICGLLRLDGAEADPAIVRAMARAMTAETLSPSLSVRAEGKIALAVLDFAHEDPPQILASDGGAWLAGDLRLDRPGEVAGALGLPETTPRHALAVAAARRWTVELPDHLDGDFALAHWAPDEERLLLARDAFGVRPLCYASIPGKVFVFASLPSGIIGSGLVEPRANLGALAERLTHPAIETTGLEDVDWLPAASAMVITASAVGAPHRAWRPRTRDVGRWRGDATAARRRLRSLTTAAVAARMADEHRVGVQLSGGLDSSAIAVLAARAARARKGTVPAYSFLAAAALSDDRDDESPFIRAVLDQEPNLIWSTVRSMPPRLDRVGSVDRLLAGPVEPVLDRGYAAARADGCVRLMSGLGGDETTSQQHERLHLAILASGRPLFILRDLAARARRAGVSLPRMAYRVLAAPLIRRLAGREPQLVGRALVSSLLTPEALSRRRVSRTRQFDARPADRLDRVVSGLMSNRVNDLSIAAARHGLAFTFPLLDRAVVEFCLSLPPWLLVEDGFMRQPFRAAMEGVLPEVIRRRDSKFLILPDVVPRLSAARPRIERLARRLRRDPAATAFVNFDAVDRTLAELDGRTLDRTDRRLVDLARVLCVAARLAALENGRR